MGKENLKVNKIVALNASQEEFERTYSQVSTDYMDWETYFKDIVNKMVMTKKEYDGIVTSLEILEKIDDENVQLVVKHFYRQVEEGKKYLETYENSLPEIEKRFERSRLFFDKIKNDIVLNENNEATLGEGFLFLIEYFHTFMKITEDSEQHANKQNHTQ